MKKILLSAASLTVLASSAFAADLPSRKEPIIAPPPPPMWTGFYAGLNAGYGFGTNSNTQSIGWGAPQQLQAYQPGQVPTGSAVVTTLPGMQSIDTGIGYALSANGPQTQNGFIGGGQIGYNYQWGSNFVIGIEADMQGTGIRGSSNGGGLGGNVVNSGIAGTVTTNPPIAGTSALVTQTANTNLASIGVTNVNAGVDWMGTVRGRLGYLVTPTLLAYATGGLTYGGVYANVSNYGVGNGTATSTYNAVGNGANVGLSATYATLLNNQNAGLNLNANTTQTYIGGGTKSQTLVGWNVGGGLEWMFMPNWSLKAEGIYWNMGNMNVPTASYAVATTPGTGGNLGTTNAVVIGGTRVNYQGVIARAGVNYHFNFGAAPVVAKF